MNTFDITQSVGDIVSQLPGASEVFKKNKIDFCCGGHRKLSVILKEQKLDEQKIIDELIKVSEEKEKISGYTNFRDMTAKALIDHILNTHHVYMKKTLPQISELVNAILRAHGKNHKSLFEVHKLFNNLKAEIEQHLIKEEEILFPAMITEKDAKHVIKETKDEHEAAGDILKELRKVTEDYKVPEDGCYTYQLAFDKLKEMESDLFMHIHLENNILFNESHIL